jgi:hypothetical protein
MGKLQELMEEMHSGADDVLAIPADATPLDFFCAIFRDPRQPIPRRMRAAEAALAFCHPKLSMNATIDTDGFATRLEEMMERNGLRTVMDAARPKAVEGDGKAGFGFTGKRED